MRTSPDGTVRVDVARGQGFVLEPGPRGALQVGAPDGGKAPVRLERGPRHVGGGIALDGGDPPIELGRTTPIDGPDGAGVTTLALRDGRAFRVVARYGRRCSVAMTGWETPGAFLEATVDRGVWTFRTTVAGEAMGIDLTMFVLLAAELTADGGDDRETSS